MGDAARNAREGPRTTGAGAAATFTPLKREVEAATRHTGTDTEEMAAMVKMGWWWGGVGGRGGVGGGGGRSEFVDGPG